MRHFVPIKNCHLQAGMMLLELLVASALMVIIASLLITGLYQMIATRNVVDEILDVQMRSALIQHYLARDIMGVFIPHEVQRIARDSTQKETSKPLEHCFEGKTEKEQFATLAFVTNNPLLIASGELFDASVVRMVRVVYALKPQAGRKDSYVLIRKEGKSLDLENYRLESGVRGYPVVSGIKKMMVKYGFYKNKNAEKEGVVSYTDTWQDTKKMSDVQTKGEMITIPVCVSCMLELWDPLFQRTTVIEFIIPIFAEKTRSLKALEKEKNQDKKEEQSKVEPKKEQENKVETKKEEVIISATVIEPKKVSN